MAFEKGGQLGEGSEGGKKPEIDRKLQDLGKKSERLAKADGWGIKPRAEREPELDGVTFPENKEKPSVEIDINEKDKIIKHLRSLYVQHFYNPLVSLQIRDPEAIDQAEFDRANAFLSELAENMTNGAILANWPKEDLEDEFKKTLKIYRDKIGGGSIVGEIWRGAERMAWWVAEEENPGLEKMNKTLKERIKAGTQIIDPTEIPTIASLLNEKKREYFDNILRDANKNHIDTKARGFIEDEIIPSLAFNIVASVIVDNTHSDRDAAVNDIVAAYVLALNEARVACFLSDHQIAAKEEAQRQREQQTSEIKDWIKQKLNLH